MCHQLPTSHLPECVVLFAVKQLAIVNSTVVSYSPIVLVFPLVISFDWFVDLHFTWCVCNIKIKQDAITQRITNRDKDVAEVQNVRGEERMN